MTYVLESLTYDELVCEVSYPKPTIAKDLRLKHKVDTGVGNKYKFQNLPINEQETGIRNGLQPAKGPIQPVESLMAKIFS